MKFFGWLVLVSGAVLTIAGFAIDPAVPAGDTAVNNIGLLNTKASLITAGGATAIVGAILALIGEVQWIAQRLMTTVPAGVDFSTEEAIAEAEPATPDSWQSEIPAGGAALDRFTLTVLGSVGAMFVVAMIYAAISR